MAVVAFAFFRVVRDARLQVTDIFALDEKIEYVRVMNTRLDSFGTRDPGKITNLEIGPERLDTVVVKERELSLFPKSRLFVVDDEDGIVTIGVRFPLL